LGDEERPGGELLANSWQGDFPQRNTGAKQWRGMCADLLPSPSTRGAPASLPKATDTSTSHIGFRCVVR
jgi:hypothetical protein